MCNESIELSWLQEFDLSTKSIELVKTDLISLFVEWINK